MTGRSCCAGGSVEFVLKTRIQVDAASVLFSMIDSNLTQLRSLLTADGSTTLRHGMPSSTVALPAYLCSMVVCHLLC
jgi:hypothetical protein